MTGILVSVVLEKYSLWKDGEEKHKFYDLPKPDNHPGEDELASVKDYVKSIDIEFADHVEGILDGLQLSHLHSKLTKEGDE